MLFDKMLKRFYIPSQRDELGCELDEMSRREARKELD